MYCRYGKRSLTFRAQAHRQREKKTSFMFQFVLYLNTAYATYHIYLRVLQKIKGHKAIHHTSLIGQMNLGCIGSLLLNRIHFDLATGCQLLLPGDITPWNLGIKIVR